MNHSIVWLCIQKMNWSREGQCLIFLETNTAFFVDISRN